MEGAQIVPEAGRERTIGQGGRWKEISLFVLFGSINTLLAYAIYLLLLQVIPYPAAYSGSYILGIFISYYLQTTFVFREKMRISKALQYPIVYVIQYLFGMASLYLLIEFAGVPEWLSPFIVAVLNIPIAYCLSRYIIRTRPENA